MVSAQQCFIIAILVLAVILIIYNYSNHTSFNGSMIIAANQRSRFANLETRLETRHSNNQNDQNNQNAAVNHFQRATQLTANDDLPAAVRLEGARNHFFAALEALPLNNAPNAQQNAPNAQRNAPNAQRNAPNAQQNAPNAPNAQRNAPNAQRNAPNAQQNALNAQPNIHELEVARERALARENGNQFQRTIHPVRQVNQRFNQPFNQPIRHFNIPNQNIPATFIIDAAFGFALGGLIDVADDDHIGEALAGEFLLNLFGPDAIGTITIQNGVRPVDMQLAAAATRSRENVINDRREAAKVNLPQNVAPAAAITAAYVASATAHTNDPQNTHDSGVLAGLKSVIDRLRADQAAETLPTIDSITEEIRSNAKELSDNRSNMLEDALKVVDRMRLGERVVTLGATDGECLCRVWLRANDTRNSAVRKQIRQAVFDGLVDAWEPGGAHGVRHIVCVNGRTTRMLAALVLLDWDKRNWNVKSLEQFKNEIFERAAKIITNEAELAAKGSDPELRNAALAWTAKSPTEIQNLSISEEATEKLAEKMRAAISRDVDEYARELNLSETLPAPMIDAVRMEAQAAVA